NLMPCSGYSTALALIDNQTGMKSGEITPLPRGWLLNDGNRRAKGSELPDERREVEWQVHASMTHAVPEVLVPVRAVDRFCLVIEVEDMRHILHHPVVTTIAF